MLKLMYVTNNQIVAAIAQKAGIDRIWIDLETKGKEERQKNLNTLKSHHCLDDIKKIRSVVTTSDLLVRVNPLDDESEQEIEKCIQYGADIIMLPMWKTVSDVKRFIEIIDSRCKVMLLLETKEAVECLDDVLNLHGIDEIHIGINDLSLSYKKKFMFEVLANGLVDSLVKKISEKGIPYGFGGITRLSAGQIPAEIVIKEHYRLRSNMAILAKSFCDLNSFNNYDDVENYFINNIKLIRDFEENVKKMSYDDYLNNHHELQKKVEEIVGKMV